ncbi:MAG TPA: SelB C-terminal domain-containing protein, partial [Mycobacteriales bacterium]|nr:SelB C-terminal domain-containing protein [Mycobacteriales bacterium]
PQAVDLSVLAGLLDRLARDPFDAPNQDQLRALDRAALSTAARTGRILNLGGGVYVGPIAPATAVERLGKLEQPFSVSDARQALGSSRRVVVPLLEHLDAARQTRRLTDGTRTLVGRGG